MFGLMIWGTIPGVTRLYSSYLALVHLFTFPLLYLQYLEY